MIICDEMKKLRGELDKRGIVWEDVSKEYDFPFMDLWICRTHFDYGKDHVSVINGHGTYGGFFDNEKENEGRLEMMAGFVNGGDPVGHLMADEVMKILDGIVTL